MQHLWLARLVLVEWFPPQQRHITGLGVVLAVGVAVTS
jgi:hypothetical protein